MTLRASGAVEPSSAVKDVTMTFLKRASTYQTAFKAVAPGKSRPCKISADVALNIIISGNLMRKTYEMKRTSLHALIRFIEWFLHLTYKWSDDGTEQTWQARTTQQKEKLASHKPEIQDDLKKLNDLPIDIPKAGAETINDGNTVRRFFKNVTATAAILRVNK
ncbi:hypothetical protein ILUMI_10356 [Ignelater luminosus]|uniref:Uncharacterized protein n=1 Tax=Ignelater luminosus TaxID=2038154 RepID=A0A8K0D0K7_IGNLU|nr:hypothetical protein ILUMI_10356 [Ignelater luminosus]